MTTHHSVMASSLRIKILKIDKFGDFPCVIAYNCRTDVFRDVISLIILNNVTPGAQRAPPSGTKCLPSAQRKNANRACLL